MTKWLQIGDVTPLFDRLTDHHVTTLNETISLVNDDENQLTASIIHETDNLFNTRCTLTYDEYMALNPFTLSYGFPRLYGLPSFIFTDPLSSVGQSRVQQVAEAALRIFEPRLTEIRVTVDQYTPENQTLSLTIRANMMLHRLMRPIEFPIVIRGYGTPALP